MQAFLKYQQTVVLYSLNSVHFVLNHVFARCREPVGRGGRGHREGDDGRAGETGHVGVSEVRVPARVNSEICAGRRFEVCLSVLGLTQHKE